MPITKYQALTLRHERPVATIVLDRPRAGNRVSRVMAQSLRDACRAVREDPEVRVAILTGAGGAFSSGRELLRPKAARGATLTEREQLELLRATPALASLEIPIIAAINGDAIDHGLELALACDLRIAARGATLGVSDLSRGVVPWDGATQRLPRIVGRARALELLLTGRMLTAEEALSIGLVSWVVGAPDLMGFATELGRSIAEGAPVAVRYAKEAVHKGMDLTLGQGLRLESDLSILLQDTVDRYEGLRSFRERRSPRFRGE